MIRPIQEPTPADLAAIDALADLIVAAYFAQKSQKAKRRLKLSGNV